MSQPDLFDAPQLEQLQLEGADISVWRHWLDSARAEALFAELLSTLDWQQPDIRIAGKTHKIPRLQAWHGDPQAKYTYSGEQFAPQAWTPGLSYLREKLQRDYQQDFNSVLVNLYRDGNDSVSWHADDERELGSNPTIASISLGETRRFAVKPAKHFRERGRSLAIELQSGDLLVMAGPTQKNWVHAVPKTSKALGARINLTFRYIAP